MSDKPKTYKELIEYLFSLPLPRPRLRLTEVSGSLVKLDSLKDGPTLGPDVIGAEQDNPDDFDGAQVWKR